MFGASVSLFSHSCLFRIEEAGGIYIIARSFDGFIYEFFKAVEGRLNER